MTDSDQDILKGMVKYGLRIQHRFVPEPLYARTGVGYLKSEGVTLMSKVKQSLAKKRRVHFPADSEIENPVAHLSL
ncbi:MAG: hypothetical protein LBD30_02650 [Verrucomicrobiales bacterium]|jgi:hypothetical protein|nr:hypothetical protein [Verrucomicrobiales bacterium]